MGLSNGAQSSVTNRTINQSPAFRGEPYRGAVAINFGADQTFTENPRGFYLSTAGTLKVDMVDGTTGVSLVLGTGYHPLQITKIYSSGSSSAVGFVVL